MPNKERMVIGGGVFLPFNIRRLVLLSFKLPNLASDWNTIWEIFHLETSSLLKRLADQFWVQDLRSEGGFTAHTMM